MNRLANVITLVLTVAVGAIAAIGMPSSAALAAPAAPATPTAQNGQALEIAPPVITLSANPGQAVTAQISLRDISSGNLQVKGQVNDFVAAGEDGTPKILLDDKEVNPYSIKGWITQLPNLVMVPKQIKTFPIVINVPADAAPGGHYGVIRFTATPPELHDTGVSLSASLGALVLITVNGKTTEHLSVASFTMSHNGKTGTLQESAPIQFTERFKNDGNVHEQPTGQVSVTDMFGKKIGAVNINVPPRNILPQSIRRFEQPLDETVLGNKKLFGHYRADLKVTYGANKQVLTDSFGFWVVPYRLIGTVIVVLIAGFIGLRYGLRYYNRRIIAKASSSRRK
jgi:hypothetical protein